MMLVAQRGAGTEARPYIGLQAQLELEVVPSQQWRRPIRWRPALAFNLPQSSVTFPKKSPSSY